MTIIWVKNDDFLNYADFDALLDNLYPIEAWVEELKEDKRPPRQFENYKVYKGYDCWIRTSEQSQWIKFEKIRIVFKEE